MTWRTRAQTWCANYEMTVFPTTEYRGKKSIIITTRTVVGGRNNFLGIAYIVVAGLCIILGVIFLASHLIKPRFVLIYPAPSPFRF